MAVSAERRLLETAGFTAAQLKRAAGRLALGHTKASEVTIREFDEATRCVGCRARYVGKVRIVTVVRLCPVHGRES